MDLLKRIDKAIKRITNNEACMRVPVDQTDPDVVLADCEIEIKRLRKALEEIRTISSGHSTGCSCDLCMIWDIAEAAFGDSGENQTFHQIQTQLDAKGIPRDQQFHVTATKPVCETCGGSKKVPTYLDATSNGVPKYIETTCPCPDCGDSGEGEWVSTADRDKLPERGRVLIFSPVYPVGHEMRHRVVDAQFVKICAEATHWSLPSEPQTADTKNSDKNESRSNNET